MWDVGATSVFCQNPYIHRFFSFEPTSINFNLLNHKGSNINAIGVGMKINFKISISTEQVRVNSIFITLNKFN